MESQKKILMVIVVLVFLVASVALRLAVDRNTPRTTYNEHAEVIGKRVSNESYDSDVPVSHFIIAFESSDNSIKELRVSQYGSGRKIYDSFHEGDKGILVYTEIENIEKKHKYETERWKGRRFISFEKDLEYGGEKIPMNENSNNTEFYIFTGIILVTLIGVGVLSHKKKKTRSHIDTV